MTLGLTRAAIANDLDNVLHSGANALEPDQARQIAAAIADTIERNNQEIERELGRRFADIERKIGRA